MKSAFVILNLSFVVLATGCFATAGLHPEAVRLNRTGVAHLRAGEHASARVAFELSLEYTPCYAEALHNLALVAYFKHDLLLAERFENEALECRADLVQAVNGLGAIARARKQSRKAAFWFEKAVEMDPGYLDARRNLILTLVDLKAGRQLQAQVARLRILNPNDPLLASVDPTAADR